MPTAKLKVREESYNNDYLVQDFFKVIGEYKDYNEPGVLVLDIESDQIPPFLHGMFVTIKVKAERVGLSKGWYTCAPNQPWTQREKLFHLVPFFGRDTEGTFVFEGLNYKDLFE